MTNAITRTPISKPTGFTLLEMLIVLAILGMLAALVVPRLGGKVIEAQVRTTQVQIVSLGGALETFAIDAGRYPTAAEGLDALINRPAALPVERWKTGPYLQKSTLPKDGWGRPFIYEISDGKYVIKSLGADGAVGGTGPDADLTSDS